MKQLPQKVKLKITAMFNQDRDIKDIVAVCRPDFPKLTASRVKTYIRKKLVEKADDLWSTLVKIPNKCAVCSKSNNLESHHLIGRNNWKYRYEPMNGLCLCPVHHSLGDGIAAHGSNDVTGRFRDWFEKNRPKQYEWFEEHRDDKTIAKYSLEDLRKIVKTLESLIKYEYKLKYEEKVKTNQI
jgi:hypothetical protein